MITSLGAGRMGRFANGAFMICSSIGVARRNNQDFAFNKWINWDNQSFTPNDDIEVWKYFKNQLPLLTGGEQFSNYEYFWGYRDLDLYGNWSIDAHMQSERYFKHCINEVRHYMTMQGEEDHEAIALHYRAGDYIANDPNAYHPRCPIEYYEEALKHVPKDMPIYLFSDDGNAAIELLNKLIRAYTYIDANYLESFKIMKRCRHFITANSSFSLLASILADKPDKIIVNPKRWFGDVAGLSTDDLYPQGAVVI